MMTLSDFYFYYYTIYLLATVAAVLISIRVYVRRTNLTAIDLFFTGLFCITLFYLFSHRSILVGTDTGLMMDLYNYNEKIGDDRDPFINFLIKILKNFVDAQGYLGFLAALYLGNIFLFIRNRRNDVNKFLFFFLIFSLFFFKTMGINVVRQGVSLAFFLNCLNFYERKQYKLTFLFILLSVAFHTTGLVPAALFGLSVFINKKTKRPILVAFCIYSAATIAAFLQINIFKYLPSSIGVAALDARSGYYTGDDWGYNIGFRPTFFIFNLIFIVISAYIYKKVIQNRPDLLSRYRLYLIYFLFASAVFYTAFQIPFSDRWGLFSWIFIPLLLEPLFKMFGRNYAFVGVIFSLILFITFEFILE